MASYYQIDCADCSTPNDINEIVCSACGTIIPDTINVRLASLEVEKLALEKRYIDAKKYLTNKNLTKEGIDFEIVIKADGKALINTQFDFLWKWLVKDKFEYKSYRRQLIDGARLKAQFENDKNRSTADSILFGSEIDIIYGALSIDEEGVISYGDIALILKNSSIKKRTSALEKNSFFFLDDITKKGWTWNTPIPNGYMAVWADIFKLSLSKLHVHLQSGISVKDMARLILKSDGDRKNDEIIELYIYGKIVALNIEKIRIPNLSIAGFSPRQKLQLIELQSKHKVECY
jgi:hypothetical protein